ILLPHWPRS
ncbi:hypothetical protein AB1N83_011507, partial [Pleurotus pulmonarius]